MRIRILSDLHREFSAVDVPDVAADIVVLAGDVGRCTAGVVWGRQRFPDVPVLYVAGNHEFYGERIGRLHEKLRAAAAGSNVTILENDVYELAGHRFFGATLWTDFNLFGDQLTGMAAAGTRIGGMNDYKKIRRRDTGPLRPLHTASIHAESRFRLTQFLAGDRSHSIVITHHAPSLNSVPEQWRGDILSAAYASNLDGLILTSGPRLWIHGHIHTHADYVLGSTRIVNNARDYPHLEEDRSGFIPDLVVNV